MYGDVVHSACVCVLLAVLFQVTPMIGVLLIPPAWLPTLRLAAVIATVALNVAVLRPLVQVGTSWAKG